MYARWDWCCFCDPPADEELDGKVSRDDLHVHFGDGCQDGDLLLVVGFCGVDLVLVVHRYGAARWWGCGWVGAGHWVVWYLSLLDSSARHDSCEGIPGNRVSLPVHA